MSTYDQAFDQLIAAGMPMPPDGQLMADGKKHYYGPKRKACYCAYEYPARNGKRYISGWVLWYGKVDYQTFRADFTGMEPDERLRLQRARVETERQEREKKEQRARGAAGRARDQWNHARARLTEGEPIDRQIPYLARKRIPFAKGLRFTTDGTLYVPMIRYDISEDQEKDPLYTGPRRLVGLQKIAADGSKLFNKGMAKAGAAFRIGPKPKDGDLILLGEGLATMASASLALEHAYSAFVAFDAGNLLPVAKILRALCPQSPILFLADDDAYLFSQLNKKLRDAYGVTEIHDVYFTERELPSANGPTVSRVELVTGSDGRADALIGSVEQGGKVFPYSITNAGREKAAAAAAEVGLSWIAYPKFADRKLPPDPECAKLTDYNDLHAAHGLDAVLEQLAGEIKAVKEAIEFARQLRDGVQGSADGEERIAKAASGKGGKGGDDDPDWELHDRMLRRFTLIYPSETSFDNDLGELVRISNMRYLLRGGAVDRWLNSPRRRVLHPDYVVFDPKGLHDRTKTVNLFRGIEMKPKQGGDCKLLLELLQYLCGEQGQDITPFTDWVLNWIAYPLQHVGAKMQSAVVMSGPEGTGKNQFWGTVADIYGRYAALITQAELEDKFNSWQSAKLFIIANEVVTRAEMSHLVGKLKNLVTEGKIYINRKMQDQRYESNHMQIVFLSNELQPLKISAGDRRYMILRTPAILDAAFYKAVGAEIKAGGAEALYAFLLARELGDFNEHSKPPITQAKEDLVDLGLLPSQLFWRELHDNLLGLPYVPALATDVYKAYTIFCARNNHRAPEASNRFGPNFMSMNGIRRVDKRVPDPDRPAEVKLVDAGHDEKLRMRRVYLMGEFDPNPDLERQRVIKGVSDFRKALRAYLADETVYMTDDPQAGRPPGSGSGWLGTPDSPWGNTK
jgi:putative DNA primase/helicase